MAHKLFHTVVFSSALVLEGCADSHELEPIAPDPGTGDGGTTRDAAPDAGLTDAFVPIDAPDLSLASCESGWPSTKAGWDCAMLDRHGPAGGFVLSCVHRDTGERLECELPGGRS